MNELSNKRMKVMLISLAIVFGGIIAFNIIKSVLVSYFFAHYVPPAVSVSSVVAKSKNWKPSISAVGNFVAINGVEVNAQLDGKVTAIHFNSGQLVEKGSPLIDIDDSVDQATLKFNQADLVLQKTNYQRQVDLFQRHATAASSLDEAKARLLKAESNVEKSQAIVDQKHIIAPFSGVLGIRQINIGQYIRPGETGIVTLQSMDPIYLQFYLPEQLLEHIHLNQRITFSIEQDSDLLFEGKISAINSKVDSNTHTIEIQATVANCPNTKTADPSYDNLIKMKRKTADGKTLVICDTELNTLNKIAQYNFIPGIFASIELEQPTIPNTVVLPSTAISYTMYGNSVFVIEKNKDGHPDDNGQDVLSVKRVFVTTGEQHGNYTVIKQGIKAGQQVVATGELKLEDGTRVTINNAVTLPDVKNIDELGQ
ncbi:MAG: efflux RND transporter periplasmic adaptor subunit [Legionellaceae bacterium]|nr:efflux RND transporter periplasmic adaptor subunit [Legionellaceae bacterium]